MDPRPGLEGLSPAHLTKIVPPRGPYLPPQLIRETKKLGAEPTPFRFSFPRSLHAACPGKPPRRPTPPAPRLLVPARKTRPFQKVSLLRPAPVPLAAMAAESRKSRESWADVAFGRRSRAPRCRDGRWTDLARSWFAISRGVALPRPFSFRCGDGLSFCESAAI